MRFATMPSTVIRRFDYSTKSKELLVEFTTGRRYVYSPVPEDVAFAMRGAFSKGQFFNAHIRDCYAFQEIERA